jgi:carboxymethylenebutenolidase
MKVLEWLGHKAGNCEERPTMCIESECSRSVTRRSFLTGAAAVAVGTAMGSGAASQSQSKALDDPNISARRVTFRSGADTIEGWIAQPRAAGQYPGVVVIPGDTGLSEYIRTTAAMLAQSGFIGLAVNLWSRHPEIPPGGPQPYPADVVARMRDITRAERSDALDLQDIQAGIDYLKSQPVVRAARVGAIGFCGGGRTAILIAAASEDVGATVSFYGTLTPLPAVDFPHHRMDPIRLAKQIRVPIQGHYAKEDPGITPQEVRKFEAVLRARGTPVEIYIYDAPHGFFTYYHPMYNAAAAKLAWSRSVAFLKRYLK